MDNNPARRAEKYRLKAEELRTVALTLSSDAARATFLAMANDYIHMAEILERMAAETAARVDTD